MKKIVLSLIYLFSSLFTFAQIYNIPKISFNFTTGADVTNIVSGKVIYAEKSAEKAIKSSMNIPEELADGIIIVEYTEKYYYQNEKKNRNFQLVYSNITPDQKYLKASEEKPIIIKENEILGKA